MRKAIKIVVCGMACIATTTAMADDYYNQKWFDIPTEQTKVVGGGCTETCVNVPYADFRGVGTQRQCTCVPNAPKVEVLRREVRVIVSGPSTPDAAVRNALVGYAAGCVAAGYAAATAGPQVVAAPGVFYGAFKACILTISASGVAGAILKQFDIKLDTSNSHWSPL